MQESRKRWWALYVLCLSALMIVLDTTIVNVALPSIREDLYFAETSLVWVVNAYMLTFSGFLLLSGRLGDLYGHRRLLLLGLSLFTLASLACGLANSQPLLITARALQGLGGAFVSTAALSLIMSSFTEASERARAMGIYTFVCTAGGGVGLLLGGLLTHALDWHWIFLVNLPIGAAAYAACLFLLPKSLPPTNEVKLDFAGAATATSSLMLAVYAIVNGNDIGWTSSPTLGSLGAAAILLATFLVVEHRAEKPLMPLALFRSRNLAIANLIGLLWAATLFGWFFICTLYLQRVLDYRPLQIGLSFLPFSSIAAAFSLGLSAKMVLRFGIRWPISAGLALIAIALTLLALVPTDGRYVTHVLPCILLLGLGSGIAYNPMLLAAISDVDPDDSGLASGVVNTSIMMGGALGIALLTSISVAHTNEPLAANAVSVAALNEGYSSAFIASAVLAAVAAILGAALLRTRPPVPSTEVNETAPTVARHHQTAGSRPANRGVRWGSDKNC